MTSLPQAAADQERHDARRRTTTTISTISQWLSSPDDDESDEDESRSRLSDENRSRETSRIACTTLPTNESTRPDITAVAGARPWRWKKRTVSAMRAAADGSATFMNDVASCKM